MRDPQPLIASQLPEFVAILGRGRKGACVALRADMDALPMQELGAHAYRSTVPGKMHACGHDGHITNLVGAARVLAQLSDELEGPVKFLFQPAEEGAPGAAGCARRASSTTRTRASTRSWWRTT